MTLLYLIEKALQSLSSSEFEKVGNAYLRYSQAGNFRNIHSPGTMVGKKHPLPRIPDAYVICDNGQKILIQHTTRSKSSKGKFISKLKKDLLDCFDTKKTGIPLSELDSVFLCFTEKITLKEYKVLEKEIRKRHIHLRCFDGAKIAEDIFRYYPFIARDYLQLPVPDRLIQPIEEFIQQYENKNISTLSNEFIQQGDSLGSLASIIINNKITIIGGEAGTGKTRIGIEAIKKICSENNNIRGCCVFSKAAIADSEFSLFFEAGKSYILLIDDANRNIINLPQIINRQFEETNYDIRLVLTVRNHSLKQVEGFLHLQEVLFGSFEVEAMDDEIIEKIVSNLGVSSATVIDDIFRISQGNARMAIMTAKVFLDKGKLGKKITSWDIYKRYFQTYLESSNILKEPNVQKCLAILSYFYSIDINSENEEVLTAFQFTKEEFREIIYRLEKEEYIDMHDHIAKISDQVLSSYFFYVVFLEEKSIDIQILFRSFFRKYESRIKDTIINSLNTFGITALEKLRPSLNLHLSTLRIDQDRFDFLKIFWFEFMSETLSTLQQRINSTPINVTDFSVIENYSNVYDSLGAEGNLLKDILQQQVAEIDVAIHLFVEYCKRRSQGASLLAKELSIIFSFTFEDYDFAFYRQKALFDYLEEKIIEGDLFCESVFCAIASKFIAPVHQNARHRGGNKVSIVTYKAQVAGPMKDIRDKIWFLAAVGIKKNKNLYFRILKDYPGTFWHRNVVAVTYDLPFLVKVTKNGFNKTDLSDCVFVNYLFGQLARLKVDVSPYTSFIHTFETSMYELYCVLTWGFMMGRMRKQYYIESGEDREKFIRQKVIKSIPVKNITDFKKFYTKFKIVASISGQKFWHVGISMDFILLSIGKKSIPLFENCIKIIIDDLNPTGYFPRRNIFDVLANKQSDSIFKMWKLINKTTYGNNELFRHSFLMQLPVQVLNDNYCKGLVEVFINPTNSFNLISPVVEKFIAYRSEILVEILSAIRENDQANGKKIYLWNSFFSSYYTHIEKNNHKLFEEIYCIMLRITPHFDYNGEAFGHIVKFNQRFILDLVERFNNGEKELLKERELDLGLVFELSDYKRYFLRILKLRERKIELFNECHIFELLFHNIQSHEERQQRAEECLFAYIDKNIENPKNLSWLFRNIREHANGFQDVCMKHLLKGNTNLSLFQKIDWLPNSYSYNGDYFLGDIQKGYWMAIRSKISTLRPKGNYLGHLAYIDNRIRNAEYSVEVDKRHKFAYGR